MTQGDRRVVMITAGTECLGRVVITGTGAKMNFAAYGADRKKVGDFASQTDAGRELLAAWLRKKNERERSGD